MRELLDIQRRPSAEILAGLRSDARATSIEAGQALVRTANDFGVGIRDYLTLAIAPANGLNGYETALLELNLPFRNDFEAGVLMASASETFQKYPGTRAMFPEVIDDFLRWQNRQNVIEQVAPLVGNSRTIAGSELISTVVTDDSAERGTYSIPELANIPLRTIRTGQSTVGMFKHGSGYRTSYEFSRRAQLDLLAPFAARVGRELELSKVQACINIMVNGDGVNAAAPVVKQITLSSYDSNKGQVLQYRALLQWLVARAKAGVPVDHVAGNYDAYLQWLFLFTPTLNVKSEYQALVDAGVTPKFDVAVPVLNTNVSFVIASNVPAGTLVGYTKAETIEELVEAGANIAESERSITNQSITYVRTETTGYKLAFADTRSIYDFGSAT